VTVVAVIADTHLPQGSRQLPDECVRRLETAELILHAGDIATESVLAELEGFAPVAAVYGNADEPALRERLPKERVVEVDGVRIGMAHVPGPALGREARLVRRFEGCDAVVYGHTHLPQVEIFDSVWILNPGSPTQRRRAAARSMLTLHISAGWLDPALVIVGT
jgi:putative phosphoesterase